MPQPIEFWFDLSSPYGYLASCKIDGIAAKHGRAVDWRPYMLGAVFKDEGTQPLTSYPRKGRYSAHDMARTARLFGVPFRLPDPFPVGTVAGARAIYWLKRRDPDRARDFAKALYGAYFADGRNIGEPAVVLEVAAEQGLDVAALQAGLDDPTVKDELKQATSQAIEDRGAFGSPFIIVDGEPFWGADRLDQIDRWLETGGW